MERIINVNILKYNIHFFALPEWPMFRCDVLEALYKSSSKLPCPQSFFSALPLPLPYDSIERKYPETVF